MNEIWIILLFFQLNFGVLLHWNYHAEVDRWLREYRGWASAYQLLSEEAEGASRFMHSEALSKEGEVAWEGAKGVRGRCLQVREKGQALPYYQLELTYRFPGQGFPSDRLVLRRRFWLHPKGEPSGLPRSYKVSWIQGSFSLMGA